jgi:AraC-like DNA-binding protein
MALVLQAAVDAEDVAGGLYAEALANALAVHLLRRAALVRPRDQPWHGGLPPSKLHGATAYIRAHLERTLSLAELAAVAQMSPAHFARLFKGATGQTPHQYVTTCRMERAKHLLTETTLSLHEIGAQVGYADQSHFTPCSRGGATGSRFLIGSAGGFSYETGTSYDEASLWRKDEEEHHGYYGECHSPGRTFALDPGDVTEARSGDDYR